MNNEKILFKCIHGSHLYGLNTPDSDIDYKGVFLPNLEDLILGTAHSHYRSSTGPEHTKNGAGDVDEVYYSLPKFMEMLYSGDTIAMDMLHAPSNPECVLQTSAEFQTIYMLRDRFYTSEMKAFMGYCKRQAAKYGLKGSKIAVIEEILTTITGWTEGKLCDIVDQLPRNEHCKKTFSMERHMNAKPSEFYDVLGSKYQLSISINEFRTLMEKKLTSFGDRAKMAKENNGVDWKAISHALRAAYQLESIYIRGDLKYPFNNVTRGYLLSVKKGELDFNDVQPELEHLVNRVGQLADESSFPKTVEREPWDEFLLSVYEDRYNFSI